MQATGMAIGLYFLYVYNYPPFIYYYFYSKGLVIY